MNDSLIKVSVLGFSPGMGLGVAIGISAVMGMSACSSEDSEPGTDGTAVGDSSNSSTASGGSSTTGGTDATASGTGASGTGASTDGTGTGSGAGTSTQNTGSGGTATNTGATSGPTNDTTSTPGAGGAGTDDVATDDTADDATSSAGGSTGDDPLGAGGSMGDPGDDGAGDDGAGGMPVDDPTGMGGAGGGDGDMGGGDPQSGGGFPCPGDPGTPNFSAQISEVGGIPLADGFGQGFSILEGPVWTGDALLFTQIASDAQPNPSRIYELAGGTASILLDDAGANGLALDADGNLLVARHSDGAIVRITLPDLSDSVVASDYEGSAFNSPNDIAYRSDGNIYFSDPSYQRPSSRQAIPTRIYRIDPMGGISVVDGDKQEPNGVALSLDESWLFASGQMPLTRYPVMADGSTGPGEPMGNTGQMLQGGDGLGRDCLGNLYVTTNSSLNVVDTTSDEFAVVGTFSFPNDVTNVAFGGADRTTMYVTTLGSEPRLYSVQLGVVGLPY